jgi:hypothetical protein
MGPGGNAGGQSGDRRRPDAAGVHVVILTTFQLDEYIFEALRGSWSTTPMRRLCYAPAVPVSITVLDRSLGRGVTIPAAVQVRAEGQETPNKT